MMLEAGVGHHLLPAFLAHTQRCPHRQARGEGILPPLVPIPIRVFGVTVHQPRREEPRMVEIKLLQLFWILGQSGREKQFLQWHLGLTSARADEETVRDMGQEGDQGEGHRKGRSLYLAAVRA